MATTPAALIKNRNQRPPWEVNSFHNLNGEYCNLGIRPKKEVIEAVYCVNKNLGQTVGMCGDKRCGFRAIRRLTGPSAGTIVTAPFACKKMALCNNCAQFLTERRATLINDVAAAHPEKKWAAAAWTIIADKPDKAIELATHHASKIIKFFGAAGVPACRWIQVNKADFAFGEVCRINLQFLFEIPRPGGAVNARTQRTVAQELWHKIAEYAIHGVIVHADDTKRYAIHAPSDMLGQFATFCSGWVSPWADDMRVLERVLPKLRNTKLFVSNGIMDRLLNEVKEAEVKEYELDHQAAELNAIAKLSPELQVIALESGTKKREKYDRLTHDAEISSRFGPIGKLSIPDAGTPRPTRRAEVKESVSELLERIRANTMMLDGQLPAAIDQQSQVAEQKPHRYIPFIFYRDGKVVDISEAYAMLDALKAKTSAYFKSKRDWNMHPDARVLIA